MTIGSPGQPTSEPARRTGEQLLGLGMGPEQVLYTARPLRTRLSEPDLEPASFLLEFGPLAHRLQRLVGGGRGVSVLVTTEREESLLRQHAAVQLALGLAPTGRQVVIVDADFVHPGLGGLIRDSTAEGVTDMARFGRSTRSLLFRPVPEGPWLLPAGSFPSEDPLPFDGDVLRSVVHRVSGVCDLALYVAPLVVHGDVHPLARVCDQVVVAARDPGHAGSALVEVLRELQAKGAQLAGVALYAAETPPFTPSLPRAAFPSELPPEPGLVPSPDLPLPEPESAPTLPAGFGQQPPATWPPPPPAWSLEPTVPPPAVPVPAQGRAPAAGSLPARGPVPSPAVEPALRHAPLSGADSESEWAAPRPAPFEAPEFGPWPELPEATLAAAPDADEAERARRELASAVTHRRPQEEAHVVARDLDLSQGDYALDEEARYPRWLLLLAIAVLVMIVGFVSWVLWSRNEGRRAAEPIARSEVVAPQLETRPGTPSPGGAPAEKRAEAAPPARVPETAPTTPSPARSVPGAPPETEPDDYAAAASARPPAAGLAGTSPSGTQERAAGSQGVGTQVSPGRVATPGAPAEPQAGTSGGPAVKPAGATSAPRTETRTETPGAPAPRAASRYSVWVGSYRTTARANADIRALGKHGFEARAVQTDLDTMGIWYRVFVGRYATAAEAEQARDALLKLPGHDFGQVLRLPRD